MPSVFYCLESMATATTTASTAATAAAATATGGAGALWVIAFGLFDKFCAWIFDICFIEGAID